MLEAPFPINASLALELEVDICASTPQPSLAGECVSIQIPFQV
jgi:hypothetical protein